MPGPPPKAAGSRRRRNTTQAARILPATGRPGAPPRFPLRSGASDAVAALWAELWATPQAVAWEDLGWTRVVARYCRWVVACEDDHADPPVALLAELRQLEDRLGLSPMAMARLRWSIEQPPDGSGSGPAHEGPNREPKRGGYAGSGDGKTMAPPSRAPSAGVRRRVKATDA
jgi:hypothetical protein